LQFQFFIEIMADKKESSAPPTTPNMSPQFQPPKLFSIPISPHLELARLHRPTAILAFLHSHLFGALFFFVSSQPALDFVAIAQLTLQLFISSFLLRCAACIWNDAADYKYDALVSRTRMRPIPRGAVSPFAARISTFCVTSVWILLAGLSSKLVFATVPTTLVFYALYPFAKRWSYCPQAYLGVMLIPTVGTGYALAMAVFDARSVPLGPNSIAYLDSWMDFAANRQIAWGLMCLALANATWAVFYDTVYAYQDIRDDEKAGVNSITLSWGKLGKVLLVLIAGVMVSLLFSTGLLVDAGWVFYTIACGGTALFVVFNVMFLDLEKPESCMAWFKKNLIWEGLVICVGLSGEYFMRL
jgi:4-hydroxybenzoate polyprenyltransferase